VPMNSGFALILVRTSKVLDAVQTATVCTRTVRVKRACCSTSIHATLKTTIANLRKGFAMWWPNLWLSERKCSVAKRGYVAPMLQIATIQIALFLAGALRNFPLKRPKCSIASAMVIRASEDFPRWFRRRNQ